MLGEGATTASPVQYMKFDEAAFDRPGRFRRHWKWFMAIGASLAVAIALTITL